ncbi:metal-dependent hydrolase [Saccharomonospora xinjiangensis XJ-54]|uniref:Metal-dependent hydrolase n=1 Tax=Saccharomonospora xinjiangensis XJ-54 TaxID=882086 RepID=I0V4Y3_9PSEU|nr:metal-dependent hydrolase [Saccharomonospora xinjiangensis XJ-54]
MRRAGRKLLPVVALVGALVATTPANAEGQVQERHLTVATFNIHHGAGPDDELDLAHVADVIADNGMDVVGLQEVDRHWGERSDFADQARWLAERLDMHVVFGANLDRDPLRAEQPRRQYGTAILSRHPIMESRNIHLPRPQGGEQRGLLEAVLLVRGVPMNFYSTHFQHNSQVERLAQAEAVNDVLDDVERPVVLVGDLNAVPTTPEIERMTTNLYDTWPVAGEGDGYTYDVATPHARIDYVLASDEVRADSARVIDTDASDHLPVVVDVVISGVPGVGGQ